MTCFTFVSSEPKLKVVWMSFGWWTILDTHRKLLSVENPAAFGVLDTNRCAWHLLQYPVQRHLNILSCLFTLWMAHTQSMTQLSQDGGLMFGWGSWVRQGWEMVLAAWKEAPESCGIDRQPSISLMLVFLKSRELLIFPLYLTIIYLTTFW
jgi:hypothetical protein